MEQQLNNLKDTAKDAARNVKDAAKDSIRDVKGVAQDAAKEATRETDRDWSGKANELRDSVKSGIETVRNIDVRGYANEIGSRAKDVGSDLYADPVGFVKRYPVTAAVGFAAVGFIVGAIIAKSRSSES
jgi:gas vesicle protein